MAIHSATLGVKKELRAYCRRFPGEASIEAVLEPADSSYLYFVSKNNGTHHFSKSYREHANAVRKYQVEYFRQRRRQRNGAGSS